MKRFFTAFMAALLTLTFASYGWAESGNSESAVTTLSRIDNTKWSYNADDNVYYQIGIVYCANPADESFENLAICWSFCSGWPCPGILCWRGFRSRRLCARQYQDDWVCASALLHHVPLCKFAGFSNHAYRVHLRCISDPYRIRTF